MRVIQCGNHGRGGGGVYKYTFVPFVLFCCVLPFFYIYTGVLELSYDVDLN